MGMDDLKFETTTNRTKLHGFACIRYDLKQRGETLEVWATDQLLPFQPYLVRPPPRVRPNIIEEHWADLLKAKKLFPLLAVKKNGGGDVQLRFEVKSITPEKPAVIDPTLFQPPPGYTETQPMLY
jgi:hypothetical protein